MTTTSIWQIIGFAGQALFSGRFIVQWLMSEREKRSVMPVAFWWLSLAGGVTLLCYSIYRADPVFIAGQSAGLVIYGRNLSLVCRERAARALPQTAHPSA